MPQGSGSTTNIQQQVTPLQLTTVRRDAIARPKPQIIFNTTTGQFEGYDGSGWQQFATEPAGGFTATSVPFANDNGELIDDVANFSYDLINHRPVFNPPRILGMTQGSVLFAGAGGGVSQDNSNFFWNATNHRLGIGGLTPMQKLAVTGASAAFVGNGADGIFAITTGTGAAASNKIEFGFVDGSYGWVNASLPGTGALSLVLNPSFGNVGVGNLAPIAKLSVGQTAATAQTFNTFIDASNYENAYMGDWGVTANVATYGTGKAGTGSTRNIQFKVGGTTQLDYGITSAGAWTAASSIMSQGSGGGFQALDRSSSGYVLMYRDAGFNYLFDSARGAILSFSSSSGAMTVPYATVMVGALTLPGGTLLATSAALTNGAAAQIATMTNGPTAGNPTKWVPINDNGTTRYIPAW